MAEKSFLWTTSSSGDGSTTYTRADWLKIVKVLSGGHSPEGIIPGLLNQMSLTGATGQVTVGTGAAVVDGRPYYNDAAVAVAIPAAVGGGNTRIDRLVLRADWTAQTVRITRLAGTDAATPSAPAITQSTGVTYDLPLCQVLVNTSGAVTVTDERTFTTTTTDGIATGAVTETKIGSGAVTETKIGSAAVTETKIGTAAVTAAKIGTGAVTETKIGTGAVTETKIADGAVTATKIANRTRTVYAYVNATLNIGDTFTTGFQIPADYASGGTLIFYGITESNSGLAHLTTLVTMDNVGVSRVNDHVITGIFIPAGYTLGSGSIALPLPPHQAGEVVLLSAQRTTEIMSNLSGPITIRGVAFSYTADS